MPAAELRAEAAARFAEWAACPSTRYLAIATTGLEGVPIEVVVLGAQGQTLLRSLAATDQPIEPGAARVHGVGAAELVEAPALAEVATDLRRALGGGPVVAFAGPWLGQRFAQAGVRVGAACLSAQPLLSAMCGAYNEAHQDFTRVRLGDIVAATGEEASHLAPLGTANHADGCAFGVS